MGAGALATGAGAGLGLGATGLGAGALATGAGAGAFAAGLAPPKKLPRSGSFGSAGGAGPFFCGRGVGWLGEVVSTRPEKQKRELGELVVRWVNQRVDESIDR